MWIWQQEKLSTVIAGAIAIVLVFTISFSFLRKICPKKTVTLAYIIDFVLLIAAFLFNSLPAIVVVSTFTISMYSAVLVSNIGEVRKATSKYAPKGSRVAKFVDDSLSLQVIADAVNELSSTKTGALITFERNISLNEFYKTGAAVNAPISKELLLTIFYPGTKLHDGAVIIKDNLVAYAAVFYTPTTKVISGKYGSRHRAALGISEISDSITVVVSEETGRISIASNGELETVAPGSLLRVLESKLNKEK